VLVRSLKSAARGRVNETTHNWRRKVCIDNESQPCRAIVCLYGKINYLVPEMKQVHSSTASGRGEPNRENDV